MKSALKLLVCFSLGCVYEISLGYSYLLSGKLALSTQAIISDLSVPASIWFSLCSVIGFLPIAALSSLVIIKLQPHSLVSAVAVFALPVVAWRLFWQQIWSQLNYEAAYFVGNFAELFIAFLLPLIFLWVWRDSRSLVPAE